MESAATFLAIVGACVHIWSTVDGDCDEGDSDDCDGDDGDGDVGDGDVGDGDVGDGNGAGDSNHSTRST